MYFQIFQCSLWFQHLRLTYDEMQIPPQMLHLLLVFHFMPALILQPVMRKFLPSQSVLAANHILQFYLYPALKIL